MRFHVSCQDRLLGLRYLEEVIGEIVDIPGFPEGSCAVHAVINAGPQAPFYAVSHIASGWRIAAGDSIDFAIRLAQETVAKTTPEQREKVLNMAMEVRRKIEISTEVGNG